MTATVTSKNGQLTTSQRLRAAGDSLWGVPILAGLLSAVVFAITLQTHINGSNHAYATDVGELQNALPRWGTIHFSGYPLYSIAGSLIVTLLRLIGIQPAMGASLVSLLWGALATLVLALLALELGAKRLAALVGALAFSVSTSMWIDSSLAEVHSMTMLFTALILLLAVRFDKTGNRKHLIWLAIILGQGVFHGRSVMGLILAVALLVIPHWRIIWRNAPLLAGIGLIIPPLLYLYLPLREWMGSDWTFGNTSTWEGFWRMFLNIKAARFAEFNKDVTGWLERMTITLNLLNNDLPLALHSVGAIGLFTLNGAHKVCRRYIAALLLALLPYVVVPIIVYAGFIGDAILAVKLPVSMFTGLGLALLISRLQDWRPAAGYVALGLVMAAILFSGWRNYPHVTAITQDRSVEATITVADQAANPDRPTVLMALWGNDFWALAYAQTFQDRLSGLTLVDHNADFRALLDEGNCLWVLSQVFYRRPVSWWEKRLNQPVALSLVAPGIVQISTAPQTELTGAPAGHSLDLENGLRIARAGLSPSRDGRLVLELVWQAVTVPGADYSVAVHLVAHDPPRGPDDILAQRDFQHPVEGWYPTSRWTAGELVNDYYFIEAPAGSRPVAVRVTLYRQRDNGSFENGPWLSLPVLNHE